MLLGERFCPGKRVEDRAMRRPSMRDHRDAAHAEQRSAPHLLQSRNRRLHPPRGPPPQTLVARMRAARPPPRRPLLRPHPPPPPGEEGGGLPANTGRPLVRDPPKKKHPPRQHGARIARR